MNTAHRYSAKAVAILQWRAGAAPDRVFIVPGWSGERGQARLGAANLLYRLGANCYARRAAPSPLGNSRAQRSRRCTARSHSQRSPSFKVECRDWCISPTGCYARNPDRKLRFPRSRALLSPSFSRWRPIGRASATATHCQNGDQLDWVSRVVIRPEVQRRVTRDNFCHACETQE